MGAGRRSTRLARAEAGVARGDQVLQRRGGGDSDDAIDALRTEMALERSHGVARGAIEIAAGGDVIAIFCQQRLHLFDGGVGFAERGKWPPRVDGGGLGPYAAARGGQRPPRKTFA